MLQRHMCWAGSRAARQALKRGYGYPAISCVLAGQTVGTRQVPVQY